VSARTSAYSPPAWRARSDRELLDRIPDDRTDVSLQTLYRRYAHELYGFAYRSLGDRGAVDELVQDVFTSVWRQRRLPSPSA
jgi:DNA-directed RNA polymerase specialized sigma24 family protein